MTELIRQTEGLVKQRMAAYDPSHDWAHVDRVRKTAMRIAKSLDPRPDLLVVELAALCHDLADAKYNPITSLESLLDPIFALHSSTLSASQSRLITTLIPFVSYSTESKLRNATPSGWTAWHDDCKELHCVQDADRLDAIGAVGVMRCAAFSGAMSRTLLGKGEQLVTAEQHFYDKLINVKGRIKTEWAKTEADKRHDTILAFMRALDEEAASRED